MTVLTAAHLWVMNQMSANVPANLDDLIDVADETGLPLARVLQCVTDLVVRGALPPVRQLTTVGAR